ncbi:MAG: response regulator transcription factor [bacterium]|nr:response regulator transcription factor [bacterium]
MTIKTIIIEDELHSRERLKTLLADQTDLDIVGEAEDGLVAIELIDAVKPDLVFLDIQMPGANGFEVLERITHKPQVIFVTAYDEYAIRAFEANAIDYILKPSSQERVAEAVRRVLERRESLNDALIDKLKAAIGRGDHMKRFAVSLADEILIIPESEVFYFKAEDKCVLLCTTGREFFFDMTLKELEGKLDPAVFCRIHKSHIISLDKVRRIQRWFHGDLLVRMEDGKRTKLKVGRSYRDELRRRLEL